MKCMICICLFLTSAYLLVLSFESSTSNPIMPRMQSIPTDQNELLSLNATLRVLARTELQLVTWKKDIGLLPYFWHSVSLFVPVLKGITIIMEEDDVEFMKASLPSSSFPFPVRTVVIKNSSKYMLKMSPRN